MSLLRVTDRHHAVDLSAGAGTPPQAIDGVGAAIAKAKVPMSI
jgi:hypothetical protein